MSRGGVDVICRGVAPPGEVPGVAGLVRDDTDFASCAKQDCVSTGGVSGEGSQGSFYRGIWRRVDPIHNLLPKLLRDRLGARVDALTVSRYLEHEH